MTPGRKGLAEMVGKVPSWVQFKEKERVEVRGLAGSIRLFMAICYKCISTEIF